MTNIDGNLLFTLIAASVTAFLGFLVFLHNRESVASKIFIVHSFVGVAWSITNYFSLIASPGYALLLIRSVIFLAVPYVLLFFAFVNTFSSERVTEKQKVVLKITSLIGIILCTLSLSPLVFPAVAEQSGSIVPTTGSLIILFGLTLVIFLIYSTVLIIRNYIKNSSNYAVKSQWLSIGFGLLLSYTLLIFFVFTRVALYKDTTYVVYSPLFVLPIFIGATYAILKHHLFNVKVFAAETFVFALLFTSFAGVIIASTPITKIIGAAVTIAILLIGILLIKSVRREVEQKELLAKLNDELGVKNTRLTDLDRQKNEFLRVASHDLKSPVGLIKQWATLIDDGTYKEPAKVHETLEKIKSTADRSIQSVDDILDVNKIEEGRMDYTFEVRDIVSFVRGITEDYAPLAKAQKNIAVTFESPVKSANVKMDTTRLRQVIQNLMSNSFKYSEKGWIKVILTEEQKSVLIAVKDSGLGMSQELLPLLFEQFRRDPGVEKKIQGTGLGLYISKLFTVAHGGEIWAESEGKGMGSTFFVRLPKA